MNKETARWKLLVQGASEAGLPGPTLTPASTGLGSWRVSIGKYDFFDNDPKVAIKRSADWLEGFLDCLDSQGESDED